MAEDKTGPVARLGDVHVVGQGRPLTGQALEDAVTLHRVTPSTSSLDMVPVTEGMALRAGDVLASRAYVSGLNIVVGDRVEALVGRGLLAHELTHVVQHGGGAVSPVNNGAMQGVTQRE